MVQVRRSSQFTCSIKTNEQDLSFLNPPVERLHNIRENATHDTSIDYLLVVQENAKKMSLLLLLLQSDKNDQNFNLLQLLLLIKL